LFTFDLSLTSDTNLFQNQMISLLFPLIVAAAPSVDLKDAAAVKKVAVSAAQVLFDYYPPNNLGAGNFLYLILSSPSIGKYCRFCSMASCKSLI
jgi:hypothetical protein